MPNPRRPPYDGQILDTMLARDLYKPSFLAPVLQEFPMNASEQTSLFDLNANLTNTSEKAVRCHDQHGERAAQLSSDVSGNTVSHLSSKGSSLGNGTSIMRSSGPEAATNFQLVNLVSHIFNESFGFRPDGKSYRLGPKSVSERLMSTDYLFIAGDGIGYLFGKEIPSSFGRIAWIESMAVRPLYRRQGIASALVQTFSLATTGSFFFGCVTPNPIAAYVVCKIVPGTLSLGPCSPSEDLYQMLKEIQKHCFDLRGCSIDRRNFRIRTGFSPLSRSDQREWCPREPKAMPRWWKAIEHLPNEFEAILVLQR